MATSPRVLIATGCRLLSMTFGRPVMISTRWDVPLPSLIDDEFLRLQGEGTQPRETPSRLGLLAYSSKLFLILDDILSTFYSSHPESNVTEMAEDELRVDKILSDVISLNRRLDNFPNEVPAYLRYTTAPPDEGPGYAEKSVEIQRQILHCRYLYTRVLLLRPIVHLTTKYPARFRAQSSTQPIGTMDDHLVKLLCNLCVQTATDLIQSIHQNLEDSYRSSAWHSIYCKDPLRQHVAISGTSQAH
ncbi:Uncharacterized protein TPAR_05450 [Tolypocladium paradoxum]|uniref:Uncharacterized protein n=1 Tax=Tolypocladium paradoxum TaxID=94208 RepID=A0A2S4KW06_9HYPO|nr:Uncharacterized protein TPAR_05450 [Tolypocladium paradoxum]